MFATPLVPYHHGGSQRRMNIQPISTDDTILQQFFDIESFSNMSSPVLSDFSDIPAPADDQRDVLAPSQSGATFSDDTTLLPEYTSFLPFIGLLPHLIVDNNEYYVDGPLTMTELEQFTSHTQGIKQFTLTDSLPPTNGPNIALETLARLGMIQDAQNPFLSSLERLRLIDANQSLSYLFFFCAVPSLKSLEISQVPSARQTTISSFLKDLVVKVPGLSSITLGPGQISRGTLRSTLKFNYLRQLCIDDAAESLDFDFLRDVSALPELESFQIDARAAQYTQRFLPSDTGCTSNGAGFLSIGERETPVDIETGSSTIPFRRLHKLMIIANALFIGDIFYHLFPREVQDVSLTLVQNGQPLQLPPHWDRRLPKPVANSIPAADGPELDTSTLHDAGEISVNSDPPIRSPDGAMSSPDPASAISTPDQQVVANPSVVENVVSQAVVNGGQILVSVPRPRKRRKGESEEDYQWRIRKERNRKQSERQRRQEQKQLLREAEAERLREEETRFRLQEERDKATNIVSQTFYLAYAIEELLTLGSPNTLFIDRLEMAPLSSSPSIASSTDEPSPFEFPSATLRMLLSCSTIEQLQFCHWSLASVDDTFVNLAAAARSQPLSMTKLQLPVDSALTSGVAITTLQLIAQYYPRLLDFQCLIQPITSLASQLDGSASIPHGLKFLSVGGTLPSSMEDNMAVATHLCLQTPRVGSPVAHDDRRRLMSIAQYLDSLFPNLEVIVTQEGCNAEQWKEINELVKMCQFSRSHHRQHAKVPCRCSS